MSIIIRLYLNNILKVIAMWLGLSLEALCVIEIEFAVKSYDISVEFIPLLLMETNTIK